MGLANKGWIKGTPQDAGWIGWMINPGPLVVNHGNR